MLMLRPRCGPPRRRSHRPGAEAATPSAAWPGCYAEARLPGTFYFSPPTKGLRRRRRAAAGGRAGLGLPGGRRLVRGGLRAGLATGRRPSAAPRANRTATNPRTTPCRAPAEAWKRPVGAVASA